MLIPNGDKAIVDIRKLRDYCLNPDSPRGCNKARVFAKALGIISVDASQLRDELLQAAQTGEAVLGREDQYGQRYTIDFEMETNAGRAIIRSGWIIRQEENVPRLTTCFVKKGKVDAKAKSKTA